MNIFTRVGEWLDNRRVLRKPDYLEIQKRIDSVCTNTGLKIQEIAAVQEEFKKSQQIPQSIAKEFSLLKAKLDQIELFIGLKREPQATHIKDTPRIQ